MEIVIDNLLKLRPYKPKDKIPLFQNSTDLNFLKYMEFKKFSNVQFNKWLRKKINSRSVIFFVIEYKKKAIGTYLLNIYGIKKQNCDISYGISSNYLRLNIFTKVTEKILKKFKKFRRFSAITRKDNLASIKSLRKFKFKKEGVLRSYYFDLKTKKYYDAIIFSYIKS